jgi:hypothetical protein
MKFCPLNLFLARIVRVLVLFLPNGEDRKKEERSVRPDSAFTFATCNNNIRTARCVLCFYRSIALSSTKNFRAKPFWINKNLGNKRVHNFYTKKKEEPPLQTDSDPAKKENTDATGCGHPGLMNHSAQQPSNPPTPNYPVRCLSPRSGTGPSQQGVPKLP